MILRVIVFMEWFWGILMEWSGKFKDLRFRYVKKNQMEALWNELTSEK